MDWIRIKPQHIWFLGYTDNQLATLVKIQTLVAMLERVPTEEELLRNIHKSSLISLEKALNMQSISIQYVIVKVMEDVQYYLKNKEKEKKRKALQREKLHPVPEVVPCDTVVGLPGVEENRIEESREDPPGFPFLINLWKARNRSLLDAYPGHLKKFRVELESALSSGWTTEKAHQRIMESNGEKPWELFKKKEDVKIDPEFPVFRKGDL